MTETTAQFEEERFLLEGEEERSIEAGFESRAPEKDGREVALQEAKRGAPWLVLAVVSHMGWGLYAVFARYLQTQAKFPLGPFQLLVMVNVICIVLVTIGYSLPVRVLRRFLGVEVGEQSKNMDERNARVRYMLLFSMLLALRASTNVYAARLIPAFWSQLVQMFTPMCVSLLSFVAFGKELPPYTTPTLFLTFVGSVMTVVGGSMDSEVTKRESINGMQILMGILSAMVSTLALSCYMVLVQKTKNLLTQEELLFNTFVTIIVVLFPTSLVLGQWHWEAFTELAPKDWAMLFTFAIFIYVGANALAQLVIRHIGATLSVMFFGTRLISAVLGSYIVLNEAINNMLEGAGLLLVGLTITVYLVFQVRRAKREIKRRATLELGWNQGISN